MDMETARLVFRPIAATAEVEAVITAGVRAEIEATGAPTFEQRRQILAELREQQRHSHHLVVESMARPCARRAPLVRPAMNSRASASPANVTAAAQAIGAQVVAGVRAARADATADAVAGGIVRAAQSARAGRLSGSQAARDAAWREYQRQRGY